MISRDDLGCAIKATHATYNGEEIPLYKNPKTDSAKKSAKGYLFVHETDNGLELESDVSFENKTLMTICLNYYLEMESFLTVYH